MRTLLLLLTLTTVTIAQTPGVHLPAGDGPGKGKHIVLISGDEEYRSEECLPQLARILNTHHGFACTVLFALDTDGTVQPNKSNIPGLEALKKADLMVIFTRFRNLPDDQMQHIADYIEAGKPVVGLRTATHAFNIPKDRKFARYSNNCKEPGWEDGFGRVVLGERWVAHHGAHGKEGTRGRFAKGQEANPILQGIADGDIFGTTDVYTVRLPLPDGCTPLVLGEVTESLKSDSKAVAGKKNDPMMPVAWTREHKGGRVFTTTMGCGQEMLNEGFRRLMVNACYWASGLDQAIPAKAGVGIVGTFEPKPFQAKKDDAWKPGLKPADYFK
jgi:type 1 glutamine amidotransferase